MDGSGHAPSCGVGYESVIDDDASCWFMEWVPYTIATCPDISEYSYKREKRSKTNCIEKQNTALEVTKTGSPVTAGHLGENMTFLLCTEPGTRVWHTARGHMTMIIIVHCLLQQPTQMTLGILDSAYFPRGKQLVWTRPSQYVLAARTTIYLLYGVVLCREYSVSEVGSSRFVQTLKIIWISSPSHRALKLG